VPFTFPPNSATGITITGSTTATLTAFAAFGGTSKATASLTIPVDPQPYTPIVTPNNILVPQSSATVILTVTGVPDPTLLRTVLIQNQSGGVFQSTATPGVFAYVPGFKPGTDIIRIFFTNGCGAKYAEFVATVF
jgi:hypothetical protein